MENIKLKDFKDFKEKDFDEKTKTKTLHTISDEYSDMISHFEKCKHNVILRYVVDNSFEQPSDEYTKWYDNICDEYNDAIEVLNRYNKKVRNRLRIIKRNNWK